MKWPPESAEDRLKAIAKARSWWSGEKLDKDSDAHFWTDPDPQAGTQWSKSSIRKEQRIHVPVAADLALVSADHLFGGGIEGLDDDPRLQEVADQVGLSTLLPVAGERASGMGEVYLRVGWRDRTVPLLNVIDPDRVVPTFSWGRMVAADVGTELSPHRGVKWVRIESHERGFIRHRLFQRTSSPTSPLTPMALTQHPETAGLDPLVRLPAGMSDRLALIYVPNARPRTNRPGGSSDTEGVEGLMAGVDEIASGLQRDFRLGKGRVIISEWLLDRTKPLDGTLFDTEAEFFSPIGSNSDDENTRNAIVPYQPDIRVTQHLDALRDYIMRIVSSAGYSPDSLIVNRVQLPESGTARRLREAASIRTTQRKIAIWRPAINEALSSLMVIAYGGAAPAVNVSIRSAYAPDIGEMALVVAQLEAAKAASTETKVRLIHPTWDDAKVADEVQKIDAAASVTSATSDTPDDVIA